MEHAKEQEYVENENLPKIILGIKITIIFDTFILTAVEVVTKGEDHTAVDHTCEERRYRTNLEANYLKHIFNTHTP